MMNNRGPLKIRVKRKLNSEDWYREKQSDLHNEFLLVRKEERDSIADNSIDKIMVDNNDSDITVVYEKKAEPHKVEVLVQPTSKAEKPVRKKKSIRRNKDICSARIKKEQLQELLENLQKPGPLVGGYVLNSSVMRCTNIARDFTEADAVKEVNRHCSDILHRRSKLVEILLEGDRSRSFFNKDFPFFKSLKIPKFWSKHPVELENNSRKSVYWSEVLAKSDEYKIISNLFLSTVDSCEVSTIYRIQNPFLWASYCSMKEQMLAENLPLNENLLFHGTTHEAAESIAREGFNRSYCGKNATMFGRGVYFAIDSCYSTNPLYSPPKEDGTSVMFLGRVLIGLSIQGDSGMKYPPRIADKTSKEFNPTQYNSTVNDMTFPGIYVVYKDCQAYPQYLIAFKRSK
ncbi:DgyrCDS8314 [Dimorphilus gyrociliatus]|uniref:Poly [ADP-ribose] polymerase n=1 Tax=Dimorphilus gyrociliatus TaxID=2664684 RepID=A0A7I8VTU3_9ANNE|nr:DgyrCDS8314 [Dimorphilus gyrociliatus]